MKEKIKEILMDICPEVDFEKETKLISDGILASFDIVSIVAELGDELDITIGPKDFIAEDSNSLDAITALVKRPAGE